MEFSEREENELLGEKGYGGQDLKFNRANRGTDDDQNLTESEYLVKTMQEVCRKWTLFVSYLLISAKPTEHG